ncbi:hypothetical protein ABH912_001017 [Pseudomonas sp. BT76 TE3572]|uniref:hypothetical protein n=1 Tax=Pseudomonas sp. BT76 TE3572 TaxID=3349325 RepID=UPI003D1B84D7
MTAYAHISEDLQLAKNQGLALYNQFKSISSLPYLKAAAESGDHETQYYLGESLTCAL